jgi:hypothetical protein
VTDGEEEVAFYFFIGRALTAWARVEGALEGVATQCAFHDADEGLIARGYRAIDNFRAKCMFVEALLLKRLHGNKPMLDRWATLHGRLSGQSKMRNEIAHWQAFTVPEAASGKRFALLAGGWAHDPNFDPKDVERLTLREIVLRGLRFMNLSAALENFAWALEGGQHPLVPEEDELLLHPPTIREIEDQMRVKL